MIRVEQGPWRAEWRGGRLADVHHLELDAVVDCFEVDGWSWETSSASGGRRELELGLAEWVADHGREILRELPYLR